jgi:hypothetical protein
VGEFAVCERRTDRPGVRDVHASTLQDDSRDRPDTPRPLSGSFALAAALSMAGDVLVWACEECSANR